MTPLRRSPRRSPRSRRAVRNRLLLVPLVALLLGAVAPVVTAGPAVANTSITGAGSTWSSIAIDQWRADVARQGLSINYQALGSTAGRSYYYEDQVDFAVSEIPFQPELKDPVTGQDIYPDEISRAAHRPYAYMPIVAGGTSFMYHLDVNGSRVTNLNLTRDVLAKIFTGVIQYWDDPAVKATNGQISGIPHLKIIPVIRSDGSGTTAQFTAFMANQTPSVWTAFCTKVGIHLSPCPATSLYPSFDGAIGQSLSEGVAAYVAAPYSNGAITYVEYGYAKARGFPVAAIQNHAGYYIQPVAAAVSDALQGAAFNADGTQVLNGVYNYPDRSAYPVSSYSYMIVPKTTANPFTTDKGATLGKFIIYFVCAGQQKAEALGYAPLPKPLVENAFKAESQIPGAPAPPPLTQCSNPTLTGGYHPPPPPVNTGNGGGSSTTTSAPGTVTANGSHPNGTGGGTKQAAAGPGSKAASSSDGTGTVGGGGGSTPGIDGQVVSNISPVTLPRRDGPVPLTFYIAAALMALAVIFGPPLIALQVRRARVPGARSALDDQAAS